ncbi:hypothetical protein CKAH01_09575 [Colletotrichum kahawae]|uniref:Uncharacterized protein n=1 Tax=Colletotrichum kahawae TaxID=34407 RepID=A0AAD9XZL5_COLKA|nr:hypothetical protein CKAH01_09575 [Colletotrichum kahawae]
MAQEPAAGSVQRETRRPRMKDDGPGFLSPQSPSRWC